MEQKKILLVCSEACEEAEERLRDIGCRVTKVKGARAAVWRAKHDNFDAAVLVSTGKEMDRAETALNLRDINPSIPIIMIRRPQGVAQSAALSTRIAEAIPNTVVLSTSELGHYLAAPEGRGRLATKTPRPASSEEKKH